MIENFMDIGNMNNSLNEKESMKKVMSLMFAVNDITLYLDTHPNDRRAIRMHNEYSNKVVKLIDEYQRKYGPLTVNFNQSDNSWDWIDNPWPWERGAY